MHTGHSVFQLKGLTLVHLNICSLRHKTGEITHILQSNRIQILALSETHLDSSFTDAELMVYGYRIFRKDRNRNGGGVAFYVQDHIPIKVRNDLMSCKIEALWIQVYLPHLRPILVGCLYRPPSANIQHLGPDA